MSDTNILANRTKVTELGAGVINYGVVCSSGYGDGGYNTYTVHNSDGKIVGIKLKF